MFQRLSIALAQVKTSNISENVLKKNPSNDIKRFAKLYKTLF